jgi:hypothetical protein
MGRSTDDNTIFRRKAHKVFIVSYAKIFRYRNLLGSAGVQAVNNHRSQPGIGRSRHRVITLLQKIIKPDDAISVRRKRIDERPGKPSGNTPNVATVRNKQELGHGLGGKRQHSSILTRLAFVYLARGDAT